MLFLAGDFFCLLKSSSKDERVCERSMDARVRIVLVEIVTMVLLLLTGHGEPAECSSDPSCEGKTRSCIMYNVRTYVCTYYF